MAMSMRDAVRGSLSSVTSTLRLWGGTNVEKNNNLLQQPGKMLKLYDMEGCPFCRLVREKLTELNLDVEIRPCPKGNDEMRDELRARGGKVQVPYLVDENTGVELYESFDIINYLIEQYGDGSKRSRAHHRAAEFTSMLASASRPMKGIRCEKPARRPEQMVELYSFESSPFCRPVRERLTEMGMPYIVRNAGKNQLADMGTPDLRMTLKEYHPVAGTKREGLLERGGEVQFPYLVDPNTGTEMYESWDIVEYLENNYL